MKVKVPTKFKKYKGTEASADETAFTIWCYIIPSMLTIMTTTILANLRRYNLATVIRTIKGSNMVRLFRSLHFATIDNVCVYA